ncbi:hypothetical protein KHC33_00430 [Methanospirillum sp. J.3.6.1-F.2.7.3]|uniref:Uncharacterized protein n=1 Tax=Methanospirillum purgamenti TaxID=2834276 RepID=A0A8E7B222_9EURY|nr:MULTISPECIES: hypothetical protein [Methanospirillum]MDX8549662.1 hypothetical protein [Methanospirillum hungatei]QVV89043.1 hypothetical protein KHC33_00430 [Methanospirillum sp. J.3.6.1-F.2.7.3]
MDDRILLAGIIPLLMVASGCILIGYAYSFPLEAILGLLLLTLPLIFLMWYILIKIENLTSGVKFQGRLLQRAIDDQSADSKRRYDDTMRQMLDLNTELSRRIYR